MLTTRPPKPSLVQVRTPLKIDYFRLQNPGAWRLQGKGKVKKTNSDYVIWNRVAVHRGSVASKNSSWNILEYSEGGKKNSLWGFEVWEVKKVMQIELISLAVDVLTLKTLMLLDICVMILSLFCSFLLVYSRDLPLLLKYYITYPFFIIHFFDSLVLPFHE